MSPATEKDLLCQIIQKQIRRYKEFKVKDLFAGDDRSSWGNSKSKHQDI